ncbi:hypothetical protein GUB10_11595 [Salegentibacter sp. BLCTC]|uniref:hypothetical protein n=1 Tax=Salegentibacter sp. BLCTC TaxID=2697368 RepID=UPI00187B3675|nr:hypothetical protein [Salegentibacter sp. BLCTC]MBE7640977.1 hypothetical protein [Salegentibacter sp. BLCTC]
MSNRLKARTKLFEKFSNQLHLLKNEGIIDIELKYDETYICQICLKQFEKSDLISDKSKNFLTEEDSPPAKLNGSRIALTCYVCNSKAGHTIDHHLINRLKEIDDSKYYNGSNQRIRVEFEDTHVNSEITSQGDGILKVLHRIENNNPNTLEKFIYGLKNKSLGEILTFHPKKKKIENLKVDKALLKTNYIISFAKFGYLFLLDDYYNEIRKEITEPDSDTSGHLMVNNQFTSEQTGTYYICNYNVKSILNVFSLKTDYSETIIGALLPFPNMAPNELRRNLTSQGRKLPGEKVGVTIDTRTYDPKADLFSDIDEINKVLNWIKRTTTPLHRK